ncbi:MAG: aminotransferase class I/II-fold pyridoxal phosphate-dependent enzyme [Actinomycetota bacterium]|nr:aminotransferase class I/II-fold pyridoxal phosphate-dependent enzyme [Actinomycetota bacterium]
MKADQRLQLLDDALTEPARLGLLLRTPDDGVLDGRTLQLDGREVLSFGSCSYLGLEMDARLREGVCDAVMRYGTQFSSSRTYLSAPPYRELEASLEELFGGPALVAASTTLGHMSTLPVVVGQDDAVVLDQQVHHSVQLAANQVRVQGTHVEVVRHNRMDLLEERIEDLRGRHRKVWYLADGVYSMYADFAPVDDLTRLLERYEQLHLYVDDSHGMSWAGQNGRGQFLGSMPTRDRVVVSASLNKAFAAAGGAFVFPDAELRRKANVCGGPMIFSGPIQPPMLGAALASARIHLSPEIEELQARLAERVELANRLMTERGLPLVSASDAPIRCVGVGVPRLAQSVATRLLDEGIFINIAVFPAVPVKQAGLRCALTLHHTPDDIERLVDAIARHLPEVLAEDGGTMADVRNTFGLAASASAAEGASHAAPVAPSPSELPVAGPPARRRARHGLTLEHATSIEDVDAREWDRLLGGRGTFTAAGLRMLEASFRGHERPEDNWDWHYFVVRDGDGTPVLATFFTHALWKDDMLSPAEVSRLVEERRQDDPYYLTSYTFAMGSLLTEGEHLYLDRSRNWRGALELMLDGAAREQERHGSGTLVLRDFRESDPELDAALRDAGLVKVPLPNSHVLDVDFTTDEEFLTRLSPKARHHQRREVLPWESSYEVEVLRPGGRTPTPAELAHVYELYRAVEERGLEINSFNLPPRVFENMAADPSWELVLLYLRPEAGGPAHGLPVAFGAHFLGATHYAPLIVGLDYDYVISHRAYRQALWQVVRRARALGARRVFWGMGASLEKRRFGARAERGCAYFQATDHYALDVLDQLAADAGRRPRETRNHRLAGAEPPA